MALVTEGDRLRFVVRRWAVLGLPRPFSLAPVSRAWEGESEGCFRFDIELSHPLFGRIVRYRGWLRSAAPLGKPFPAAGYQGACRAASAAGDVG